MHRTHGLLATFSAVLLAALSALALTSGTAAAAGRCDGARVSPADSPRAARAATLCLLNAERAAHGLRPLRASAPLAKAARRHSRDMVRRSYFSHTAPGNVSFVDRIQRADYAPRGGWAVGENIAWGGGELSQPARVVKSWMNSPGHRANILNGSFRAIGIGIARGVPVSATAAWARSGATYTTDFGSR